MKRIYQKTLFELLEFFPCVAVVGVPIEIKYSQKVLLREMRGIRDFIREHNCPYGLVINNDERVTWYDENLLGIPFACCVSD